VALGQKASRRYILSGTVVLGDPRHLYPQMKFLSPAIMPEDWFKFLDTFLVKAPWNKHIVKGYKNLHILNERLQRVSIQKTKDLCLDLPPRQIIDISVDLSDVQKKAYNTMVEEMEIDIDEIIDGKSQNKLMQIQNAGGLLIKLAQVSSGFLIESDSNNALCNGCSHLVKCVEDNIRPHTPRCQVDQTPLPGKVRFFSENPKLDQLDELLESILQTPTHKVIVWAVFRAELELISKHLEAKGIGHVVVSGATGNELQANIDKFNNDPACKVYVAQEATGVGITLNAASWMIFFSMDWQLDHYLQAIDRNYRVGQTQKTTVYRLLGKGTVDEYKAAALSQKRDISRTLTNVLSCVLCPKRIDCLNKKIALFDPGCMYQRGVKRAIAKAEIL
jgi:SNF2 family DNA or RNA helicase